MPAPYPKSIINAIIAAAKTNPDTETFASLASRFNVSLSVVYVHLKRNNIHLTPKQRLFAKYSVDESFFSVIDTPAKAQILGFIYADGCLSAFDKAVSIGLAIKDEAYLRTINHLMGHTKPLYYRRNRETISPETGRIYPAQDSCILTLTRKRIYNDLFALGLRPRKSYLDLPLPPIPDHLIRWFILGLFEGDGCLTYTIRRGNTVVAGFRLLGSLAILEQIGMHIKQHLAIPLPQRIPKDGNVVHVLRYDTQHAVTRLMEWLYAEHTGLRLERKYAKWLEIKQRRTDLMKSWTPRQIQQGQNALKPLPPVL